MYKQRVLVYPATRSLFVRKIQYQTRHQIQTKQHDKFIRGTKQGINSISQHDVCVFNGHSHAIVGFDIKKSHRRYNAVVSLRTEHSIALIGGESRD